jgi:hypothetical protein
VQVVHALHRRPADRHQDVALPESHALGRASLHDLGHLDRLLLFQLMEAHHTARQRAVLRRHPQNGTAHASLGQDLRDHPVRRAGGDGETDPLRHDDDGGVHADHLAVRVDERSAGVSRVEGSGVLDDVLDEATVAAAKRAPHRAHHPGGDGGVEAQRVADGDDELSDAKRRRVAQRGVGKTGRPHPHHGEIGGGVLPHQLGAVHALVGEAHLERGGAMHDVAVGEDVSVRRDHDPRAAPCPAARALGRDEHHRGRDRVDDGGHRAGEVVEKLDLAVLAFVQPAGGGRAVGRRAGNGVAPDLLAVTHRLPPGRAAGATPRWPCAFPRTRAADRGASPGSRAARRW